MAFSAPKQVNEYKNTYTFVDQIKARYIKENPGVSFVLCRGK
jgi:hypothetical protein